MQVELLLDDGSTMMVEVASPNVIPKPPPTPPQSTAPPSWLSEELLASVKAEIKKNPNGKHALHFQDMLVNGKSNGGGRRTTRSLFSDPNYVTAPGSQFSPDGTSFPTTFGQDAYAQNLLDDMVAVQTLAIRSRLDPDATMAAKCEAGAIRVLSDWVTGPKKLTYVDSQWSDNTSRGKLFAGWSWQQLGPALSILWPSMSQTLKDAVIAWAWVVFMDESVSQTGGGTVYAPDGRWIRGKNPQYPAVTNNGNLLCEPAGSNHLVTYFMTRIHIGLLGGPNGKAILDKAVADLKLIAKSFIYFDGDSHYNLGPGYPQSPIPHGWPAENQFDTAAEMSKYWFSPPAYISGLSEEVRRDRGHEQMSVYGIACINATLTAAGLGDWFTSAGSGITNWQERIVAEAEMNNGWYREALTVGWAAPYNGNIDNGTGSLSLSSWAPKGWVGNWTVGGNSADHAVHIVDYFMRQKRGLKMPNTQAVADVLSGTGTRSSTNAAGVTVIRAVNQFTWEALLFSPIS